MDDDDSQEMFSDSSMGTQEEEEDNRPVATLYGIYGMDLLPTVSSMVIHRQMRVNEEYRRDQQRLRLIELRKTRGAEVFLRPSITTQRRTSRISLTLAPSHTLSKKRLAAQGPNIYRAFLPFGTPSNGVLSTIRPTRNAGGRHVETLMQQDYTVSRKTQEMEGNGQTDIHWVNIK